MKNEKPSTTYRIISFFVVVIGLSITGFLPDHLWILQILALIMVVLWFLFGHKLMKK